MNGGAHSHRCIGLSHIDFGEGSLLKVCYLSCVNTGNGNNLFAVKPELKVSWAFFFLEEFFEPHLESDFFFWYMWFSNLEFESKTAM